MCFESNLTNFYIIVKLAICTSTVRQILHGCHVTIFETVVQLAVPLAMLDVKVSMNIKIMLTFVLNIFMLLIYYLVLLLNWLIFDPLSF